MTAGERAKAVYQNSTGVVHITRYACDSLEANIAAAVREAEAAATARERARCRHLVDGAEPFIGREGVAILLHEIDHPDGG